MSPAALDQVLGRLTPQHDPNLLIGFDTADDAGVYRIAPDADGADRALVQTVDFFTPIVDDPFTFGQIAATNALSDVYAMGGVPRTALAIVCFPDKGDLSVLEQILAGGLSMMIEAHCTVVGGHSVRDPEIKFGYAVTGLVDPRRVLANSTAQPGDALLFTKALGTGVISTAIKQGEAEPAWIDAAVASMTTLNRAAAQVIARQDFPVHACTDVTGFGLLGHAREMALGSNVALEIRSQSLLALPGALDCIARGFIPGGLNNNREFAQSCTDFAAVVPADLRALCFDPQTSGGLLISVAAAHALPLEQALHAAGVTHARTIGRVLARFDSGPELPLLRVI